MKKVTDILSGVLAFGIMIGLLAAPIYFLRWYEVIAIHFVCFIISFILSKVVTKRKFKDPQNVYIASLLFGIAGLLVNFFDWKKTVNDEEEEIKNKLKYNDESPEFIEFGKNILEGENHLAIEIFCKNSGLFYCSEKNVPNEFGSPLTENEIREFLKDKTSDEKLSEILKYRFNIYKGDWESSGYAWYKTEYAIKKIKEYIGQSKKVSLEGFEEWFLNDYRQNDSYNDPKDIVSYEEGYELSYSSKKNEIKITPLFIYNTLYKECNLFWNNLREIRNDYSEPINPEFNDRVLKPLLYLWENSSKEDYHKKSIVLWRNFLLNEVLNVDIEVLEDDYLKAFIESDAKLLGEEFKGVYFQLYAEGSKFLDPNDEVLFYGVNMRLLWRWEEYDEDGEVDYSDYNISCFNDISLSWKGFVANLPNYYYCEFTNGSSDLGEGKTLNELCELLSELPITDYNKFSEEEKEDISYIKFPHKDDVIEEAESEVVLNTDLPDYWSNSLIKKEVSNYTKLNDQVLKKLIAAWGTSTKAEYEKRAFQIWKEYFVNDVLVYDLDKELYESFIKNDTSFSEKYQMLFELNIMSNGFLDEFDNEIFEGKQLSLRWYSGKYNFDEKNYEPLDDGEVSQTFYDIPMAINGLIANLPNWDSYGDGGGYGELGYGASINELCEILSKLPIKDYNALPEEHKKCLFKVEFEDKRDNDQSLQKPIKKEEVQSLSSPQEFSLSEFIDNHGIEETLEKIQNDEKEIVISLKISNRNGLLSCKCNKNNLELLDEKRIADYLSQYDFDSVIKADELPRNLKVINPLYWDSIGRAIVSKTESINYLTSLINNDSDYDDIDDLIQDYIIEDCSHAYVEEYFEQEKWEAIEISKFCDGCSEFDLISDGMVEGIEHETTIRNKATTQTNVENESLQESQKAERVKSFCTNCGESISAGDKFCGSCGTKTN